MPNSLKEGSRVRALIHNINGRFKKGDKGTVIDYGDGFLRIWFDKGTVVKIVNPDFYEVLPYRLHPADITAATDIICRLVGEVTDERALTILGDAYDYIAQDYPNLAELAGVG